MTAKVPCPICGGLRHPDATACRRCHPGRPLCDDAAYARQHGLTKRQVRRLGGAEKLRSLTPDALAVLLKPLGVPGKTARQLHSGGLAARGLLRGRRGIDTQAIEFLIPPMVEDGFPLEMALTDEALDGLRGVN